MLWIPFHRYAIRSHFWTKGKNCASKIGHQPGGDHMLSHFKIAPFFTLTLVFALDV